MQQYELSLKWRTVSKKFNLLVVSPGAGCEFESQPLRPIQSTEFDILKKVLGVLPFNYFTLSVRSWVTVTLAKLHGICQMIDN